MMPMPAYVYPRQINLVTHGLRAVLKGSSQQQAPAVRLDEGAWDWEDDADMWRSEGWAHIVC
jgi:hypothetical protein